MEPESQGAREPRSQGGGARTLRNQRAREPEEEARNQGRREKLSLGLGSQSQRVSQREGSRKKIQGDREKL